MSGEHEDLLRPKSWPQDQMPSGNLDNRTTNKGYGELETLQPEQIDPQQTIPDRLHSLELNAVAGLGQRFIGTVHPATFAGVGNLYIPSVQTGHPASYEAAGGNEKSQYYDYDSIDPQFDQEHIDVNMKATTKYDIEMSGTYLVEPAFHRFGTPQDALAPSPATPHPSPYPDRVVRVPLSRSQSQSGRIVICPICFTTFSGKHASGNLTRHQKSQKCASSDKKKEFPCDDCNKTYQRSDALRKHERRVHGRSPAQI